MGAGPLSTLCKTEKFAFQIMNLVLDFEIVQSSHLDGLKLTPPTHSGGRKFVLSTKINKNYEDVVSIPRTSLGISY